MIGYVCMLIFPRKYSHVIVILTTGGLLTLGNIIEHYKEETGYNISTLAMITFVKQYMLATNYRDGNGDLDGWLTSREKKYALKDLPTFTDYCNYLFPLVSSVIGPSFEYKDWNDYLNVRGDYAKMRPFSNYFDAFKRFGQGVIILQIIPIV